MSTLCGWRAQQSAEDTRTTPLAVWVLASTLTVLTGMSLLSRSETDLPMSLNLTGTDIFNQKRKRTKRKTVREKDDPRRRFHSISVTHTSYKAQKLRSSQREQRDTSGHPQRAKGDNKGSVPPTALYRGKKGTIGARWRHGERSRQCAPTFSRPSLASSQLAHPRPHMTDHDRHRPSGGGGGARKNA